MAYASIAASEKKLGVKTVNNPAKSLVEDLLLGTGIEINGGNASDLKVHNDRFYDRVLRLGSLGLGESYMDGWWDCEALDQFFAKIFNARLDQKIKGNFKLLTRLAARRLMHLIHNPQNREKALVVGETHYDIGNDLYTRMLDSEWMCYTCGYWKNAKTLEKAQADKLELICQKLGLQPGMRLLDIGCGFGGMAKYAAEHYQVEVVGVTISKEQQKLARERCKDLPVDIRFQDYRDIKEEFDRVVSIGMFEHVGPKNYHTYMKTVAHCLKDGGLFLLHTIGSNTSLLEADPWIRKYIFPHGALPSIQQIGKSIEKLFVMEDWHNFGFDYSKTLKAWHANFVKHYEELKPKYDERFYRMWRYYLLSCAGAFYARDLQLWQVVLSKEGVPGGYHCSR